MTCEPELSGWASGILDGLGETGYSVGSVVTWLETHLGSLNLALRTSFVIDSSGCISGDMDQAHSGIYTEMYLCDYYRKKANENLGASAYDWTFIEGEDQGTIRRVSKNEVAKTYMQLRKDCKDQVDHLIQWYHSEYLPNTACQVLYNQRVAVTATALTCPPTSYYAPTNYIWATAD
jgi:hypothetical protein